MLTVPANSLESSTPSSFASKRLTARTCPVTSVSLPLIMTFNVKSMSLGTVVRASPVAVTVPDLEKGAGAQVCAGKETEGESLVYQNRVDLRLHVVGQVGE